MSKDFLNKIKGAIQANEAAKPSKPEENSQAETSDLKDNTPVNNSNPTQEKPKTKEKVNSDKTEPKQSKPKKGISGFEDLLEILKTEKEGFSFNRRLVYIDDNIGEALDLLRKKAKINSNVLASYLLKQFLLDNKDLIKKLKETTKQDNMFLD